MKYSVKGENWHIHFRRILLILAICLTFCFVHRVSPAIAMNNLWNTEASEGLWQYKYLEDGTVEIVGYANEDYEGVLTVPGQLGGKTVTIVSGLNNMPHLTEVILPDTIRAIGSMAFFQNRSLKKINLPDGIASIGESAFEYCSSLDEVDLPDALTMIRIEAFSGTALEKIIIPESVILIEDGAFRNCKIHTVTFSGNGELRMTGNPFYGNEVESFVVPADHPWLGTYQGVLFDKNEKKLICYPIAQEGPAYEIPNGIRKIGRMAFAYCGLEKIIIPDTLLMIDEYAFYDCDSLKEVIIPDSVTTIGDFAFYACDGMKYAYIGDGVTTLGDYAFAWCDELEVITIGNGLQKVGEAALSGNCSLKCFILREGHPFLQLIDGVLFIRDGQRLLVYPAGKTETIYDVPVGTGTIEAYAFSEAQHLRCITISGTVKTIGDEAFIGMDQLEEIQLEEGIEVLGDILFWENETLKVLTIPGSVRVIHPFGLDYNSSVIVRTFRDTVGEDQAKIDGLKIEYLSEEEPAMPAWLDQ